MTKPHKSLKMKVDSTLRGTIALDSGVPIPGMIHFIPPRVAEVTREQLRNFPHSKRVGNYLLGKTLGEGSFAKVKEGLHILTGEKVAVKVIDKKKAKEDAYVRKNMRREGKLLQTVKQKHVVRLFEIMETENSYYLVTELCRGGDLMDHICNKRRLDEREARRYIRQIILAVEYLHRAGILHRDLKVENLLLDENRDIKIIDFGLSNSVRVTHTKEGSVAQEFCVTQCGSPAYAAPELLGNKKYGHKVDIWSIGVNMFAMLTGNLPFTVEPFNIKALHNKMLKGDMNNIPEHLSKECKDLLKRFLTAEPDKRITLQEAMKHPWITEGATKSQIESSPFPNKLNSDDLDQNLVKHMSQNMEFRLSEIIRLVTNNVPSSCNATYNLLLRKLTRYNAEMRVQGRVSASGTRLLCGSESSQQTASTAVPISEEREPRISTSTRHRSHPPSSSNDKNNNMNEREASDEDEVIEVNILPKKTSQPETVKANGNNELTDANGNVANEEPSTSEGHQTTRSTRENNAQSETVQLFRMTNTKGLKRTEGMVREDTYVIEDATPRSPNREDTAYSGSPAVPRDLPMIVQRQATEEDDTETRSRRARATRQSVPRTFAPAPVHSRQADPHNSSQSTTSSNGRSLGSGPSGPPIKGSQDNAEEGKPASVSDPSPRREKQSARGGKGSPKRYTIDIVHYERFARKGGIRMFPSVDGIDRSRKLTNHVYPTYHKGKSYLARQFLQRNTRTFSREGSALGLAGTERNGRMTALLRASIDNSPSTRKSETEEDRVIEVNMGCRTAIDGRTERRGSHLGLGSARAQRVELPSISPSQLKGKEPH